MPFDLFPDGLIVDTVVVNYFTMLGRFPLLAQIVGGSVHVPTVVYEPSDEDIAEDSEALSEIERGRRLHLRRVADDEAAPHLRERSRAALPHFEALKGHVQSGRLIPVALTDAELRAYAEFRDRNSIRHYGLVAGLGRGEAAALAIAETRSMRLATDDQDCIKVAAGRNSMFEPVRIRQLLLLAVEHELIGRGEARSIHLSMVAAGFWDRGRI